MKEWVIDLLLAIGVLKPAEPEQITIVLPCGAEVKVVDNCRDYFKICTENNYSLSKRWFTNYEHWTLPMKEVYLLFIKDFNNFKKEDKVREDLLRVITTYTHNVLGYSFSTDGTTNMKSLTYDQLYSIRVALNLYKYSDRCLKYKQLKEKQMENRRLRQAKKDAAKIINYLENKNV